MIIFSYGESADVEQRIDERDWMAASAANEASVAVAKSLCDSAWSGAPASIPGTAHDGIDYALVVRPHDDAVWCEIHRADGVLVSTLTIVPKHSSLTRAELPFDPPCCVVRRALGALASLDTAPWLKRFEQALAIAVLDRQRALVGG